MKLLDLELREAMRHKVMCLVMKSTCSGVDGSSLQFGFCVFPFPLPFGDGDQRPNGWIALSFRIILSSFSRSVLELTLLILAAISFSHSL